MSEIVLKSRLTQEEIEANFEGVDLYSGLMEGLEQALAYKQGDPDASKTAKISIREG